MRSRPTVLSFACIGLVGGAVACALEDLNLLFVVTPLTMIMCAVLGAIVGRLRHGWVITMPLVPLAGALNGAIAAAIVVHEAMGAAAVLGLACSLPFLLVLPPIAYLASTAEARPSSLAGSLERWRLVAATMIACTLLAVGLLLRIPADWRQQMLANGLTVAMLTIALVGVATVLAYRRRATTALRRLPLLRASEPEAGRGTELDGRFIDLGLGTTLHLHVDPATLLREMPAARVMYQGDARRVVDRATSTLAWLLLSFCAVCAFGVLQSVSLR